MLSRPRSVLQQTAAQELFSQIHHLFTGLYSTATMIVIGAVMLLSYRTWCCKAGNFVMGWYIVMELGSCSEHTQFA